MLAAVTIQPPEDPTPPAPHGLAPQPAPTGTLAPPTWRRWVPALVSTVAVGMHLVAGVPYAATGLLAPGWAVAVLAVWWLVLAGVLLLLALRGNPWWTLVVPVAAMVTWVLAVMAGGAWLGWNA